MLEKFELMAKMLTEYVNSQESPSGEVCVPYLPKRFQLPNDVIATVNGEILTVNFNDGKKWHSFEFIAPEYIKHKHSYGQYGLSRVTATLPFVVCTITKDDPYWIIDRKFVPRITRMKEAKKVSLIEENNTKKFVTHEHAFRTNEEIKQAYPNIFTKRITPFEEDVRIQIYRIKEQDDYWIKQTRKNIPESVPKDIRKEIERIEKQKHESFSVHYKNTVLLSKSKDDNLLNLIIRAFQNEIIKIDNDVYKSLVKLLKIESIVKNYDQQNSKKTSFEIIQEAIKNCKIQTTFNGFKKLVSSSLKKQLHKAYSDEQKHKYNELRLKEKPPAWFNHLEAYKYYTISKTTFYREIKKNKNDKSKVNYELKELSKEYCENLSDRLNVRNNIIEKNKPNKNRIPDIAKHFKVAESTVQKHLPKYVKKYDEDIQKSSGIIHPKRAIRRIK